MNKQTATYNTVDLYQVFVKKLLSEHPEYWSTQTRYDPSSGKKTRSKTPNAYIYVKGKGGTVIEVMSFVRWERILKLYYLMGRKKIISGEPLQLGHNLGKILPRTLTRFHGNRKVDWYATKQQTKVPDPVTGQLKYPRIIYHTSDTYSRIVWKKLGKIPNEGIYTFQPAKGNRAGKGFTGEFSTALKQNPLLATKFEQATKDINL